MIKVINFPFCNFHSLIRYFNVRKHPFEIYDNSIPLKKNDILIIPGVGTFGLGMEYIESKKLRDPIIEHSLLGGKIIGICLGMQLLLNTSEESSGVNGLGIIKGNCKKLLPNQDFSVPHIGWNTLEFKDYKSNILLDLSNRFKGNLPDFYFVHSYHCVSEDISLISSFIEETNTSFAASIEKDNIQGYQFHPEKSGKVGYMLLDQAIKS